MTPSFKHLLQLLCLVVLHTAGQAPPWSLQACIEQALKNNVSLNQAGLSNQQNMINLRQARFSLVPTLNITEGQALNFGRTVDPFTNQFVNQNISTNNAAATSTITLFSGMQNINTIRQSKLGYEAGNLDIQKMQNDLGINVTLAYLQLLFSYDQLEIVNRQLSSTYEQLKKTELNVKVGKLTETNLFQTQSQLASDKLALTNAENQVTLNQLALLQWMGMPMDTTFRISRPQGSDPVMSMATLDEVYKAALNNQPQIKSGQLKTQSALLSYEIARGGLLPRLYLAGTIKSGYSSARKQTSYQQVIQPQNIGYVQSNPSETVIGLIPSTVLVSSDYPAGKQFSDNIGQSLSLNLVIPILNNLSVKSNMDKARLNIENAKLAEQATKDQLRKAVEQSYTDVVSALKKYQACKEQLSAEERTCFSMEKQFDVGMASTVDLIIERNNYTKALLSLSQAKHDLIFKLKILEFYQGIPLTL